MKPCCENFEKQIPNDLEFYFAITLDNKYLYTYYIQIFYHLCSVQIFLIQV